MPRLRAREGEKAGQSKVCLAIPKKSEIFPQFFHNNVLVALEKTLQENGQCIFYNFKLLQKQWSPTTGTSDLMRLHTVRLNIFDPPEYKI